MIAQAFSAWLTTKVKSLVASDPHQTRLPNRETKTLAANRLTQESLMA